MSASALCRSLRRIASGSRLSALDVPILEDAADALEQMEAACQSVLWWNERTGGMCEPEDERDVLQPLRAAIGR
jgi:hypothetical protein